MVTRIVDCVFVDCWREFPIGSSSGAIDRAITDPILEILVFLRSWLLESGLPIPDIPKPIILSLLAEESED
jgi:hypothetical protein